MSRKQEERVRAIRKKEKVVSSSCLPWSSNDFDADDLEELRKHEEDFKNLKFDRKEIKQLYRIFRRIDFDRSKAISIKELMAHLRIDETRFAKRIFTLFDDDKSGQIDFKEFVFSLWNYCTLGVAALVVFAFDMYDRDSGGTLTKDEVIEMMFDVYGENFAKNIHAKAVVKKLEALEAADGIVDLDDFKAFAHNHPALLFPAFQMQEVLRCKILGVDFWEHLSRRRVELCKGKFVTIYEFMEIHANKDLKATYEMGLTPKPVFGAVLRMIGMTGPTAGRSESWGQGSGSGGEEDEDGDGLGIGVGVSSVGASSKDSKSKMSSSSVSLKGSTRARDERGPKNKTMPSEPSPSPTSPTTSSSSSSSSSSLLGGLSGQETSKITSRLTGSSTSSGDGGSSKGFFNQLSAAVALRVRMFRQIQAGQGRTGVWDNDVIKSPSVGTPKNTLQGQPIATNSGQAAPNMSRMGNSYVTLSPVLSRKEKKRPTPSRRKTVSVVVPFSG